MRTCARGDYVPPFYSSISEINLLWMMTDKARESGSNSYGALRAGRTAEGSGNGAHWVRRGRGRVYPDSIPSVTLDLPPMAEIVHRLLDLGTRSKS